ncbi:MAG: CbtA family protein [Paracoccaceae bacterium]
MTKNLFTSALFAGLAAGLIAALLQFWLVIPLLLEGELYEIGLRAHFAVGHDTPVQSPAGPAGSLKQDISRHAMTLGFNVISFTAFALIMVAGMAFAERFGHRITARTGIIWGVAGFTAMHLAPAIGLPPELPGTIAAEVEQRQIWFLATVAASTIGIALIALGKNPLLIPIGIAALAMPHIIGAPQLDTYFGIAPPELASLFVTRSLGVAAIAWAIMGSVAAYFWARHSTQ